MELKDPLIYLFVVLRRFQHCTGHMLADSWKDRGNQYIQLLRVLYCKLPTNGKQLPAQRWEAIVLPSIEKMSKAWLIIKITEKNCVINQLD